MERSCLRPATAVPPLGSGWQQNPVAFSAASGGTVLDWPGKPWLGFIGANPIWPFGTKKGLSHPVAVFVLEVGVCDPTTVGKEQCDGVDNNNDGQTDEGFLHLDNDGILDGLEHND
jgi:hypothetical protein